MPVAVPTAAAGRPVHRVAASAVEAAVRPVMTAAAVHLPALAADQAARTVGTAAEVRSARVAPGHPVAAVPAGPAEAGAAVGAVPACMAINVSMLLPAYVEYDVQGPHA